MAMSRSEVDGALRDRAGEWADISAALVTLDTSAARKTLERTPLDGATREQWAEAAAASGALWECFQAYREVLDRARSVRDRRPRPGPAELDELTALLSGPAVVLTVGEVPLHDRRLTGPTAVTERLTLAAALTRMTVSYALVSGVVGGADAVWSATLPRLDDAVGSLSTARALAVGLGADVEPDLARFERELARIRQSVASDPLSMWDATTGAVRAERLDDVLRDLDSVHARIAGAVRLRDEFADRLTGFANAVDRLAAAEDRARAAVATVGAKVCVPLVPAAPATTPALRGRIESLAAGQGDWYTRLAETRRLERDLTEAEATATAVLETATGLLARRHELRGRLDAYRAKAGRLGHAEDAELHHHYLHARDLLWTAPADLVQAEAAVTRYQRALTDRLASRTASKEAPA